MQAYLNLLEAVVMTGERRSNRTGIDTISSTGHLLKFDLRLGFPAVTTKRLAFKSAMGELVGFLRGYTSAADFRALGCRVWDANANENPAWLANPHRKGEDDLGPIYGAQWRSFGGVDQIERCLQMIRKQPDSRQILLTAWNPTVLDQIALPACHVLYQFHPSERTGLMDMSMYMRSNDLFLGAPFNIAEGAALLSLMCHLTGYQPRLLNYHIADAHVYVSHLDAVQQQLGRTPRPLPTLSIDPHVADINLVRPADFSLVGYHPHAPLTAPMAV